ncbi:hypothetical protein L861_12545 [Litchfieldella anticariensis FP35 = DSM 16096]|uniref:Thioesterase domain-containing protein n=1 Tax=Litchfieldella anticariensis (strain DSM 16096 / CECT 5854 / CIP 108499 / LMG 22089 / FP35) TaxID=1121939 RepID=S2L185_LITA3|nr:PaaI family thioesterase [Halomonas anticariensis]EPC01394.1 hypothetical protein L861_12545 [Halomonas anticariensis FP35 = DSM 16096]
MQERISSREWLERTRTSGDVDAILALVPYAQRIGVSAMIEPQGRLYRLAPQQDNIGNVLLPALHGGVVAAFMETAASLELMLVARAVRLPKVIDFSIDYLRTANLVPTLARCTVLREGRRMANVQVCAWQDDATKPIAMARLHLLLAEPPDVDSDAIASHA